MVFERLAKKLGVGYRGAGWVLVYLPKLIQNQFNSKKLIKCKERKSNCDYFECKTNQINIFDYFPELDKSSADVAAEGAILNEMLEIVAKRAALRPSASNNDLAGSSSPAVARAADKATVSTSKLQFSSSRGQSNDNEESNVWTTTCPHLPSIFNLPTPFFQIWKPDTLWKILAIEILMEILKLFITIPNYLL